MTENDQAHRTAIARKKPSAPMRWLESQGLIDIEGGWSMLDYGCGRGTDADAFGMDKYDPHYFPWKSPRAKTYMIVTCNYVLNVIPTAVERRWIVQRIRQLLAEGGVAYITVRNDGHNMPNDGDGGWTSIGTWQGLVDVPEGELIREVSGYRMYKIRG